MTDARPAASTVTFIDEYCQLYQNLFPDVRSFEHFKRLHMGMLSEIKRKTLPAIAKATGESDAQALHHFVAQAPWSVEKLREKRLTMLKQRLAGRAFTLCIDETGDRKKGKTTDYVASQYIGNIGKIANGIVSINAYGVLDHTTFPLLFKVYKPQTRLKPEDTYQTKPKLAVEIVQKLQEYGFHFDVVLADCLSGESGDFITALEKLHLKYVLAIRSNHEVWLPTERRIRFTRWRPFECVFSNGERQARSIREVAFGRRGRIRYYQLTADPRTLRKESTWTVLTNLKGDIRTIIGNTYGLCTWIEYDFKHARNELGWADYRVTNYAEIERWWEIVFSAYLLVSFHCPVFHSLDQGQAPQDIPVEHFAEHHMWDQGQGWKNILNNLRLILQPHIFFGLILHLMLVFRV